MDVSVVVTLRDCETGAIERLRYEGRTPVPKEEFKKDFSENVRL